MLKTLSRVSVPDKADPHARSAVGEQRVEEKIQIEVETATVRATALVSQMASWQIQRVSERSATELANLCIESQEHLQFLAECRRDEDAASTVSSAVAAGEDPEATLAGSTP